MPRRAFVLLTALASVCAIASVAHARARFALTDQFERRHTHATVFDGARPVILAAGDQRATGDAMPEWLRALEEGAGERASVYGMVNLEILPFFVPEAAIRADIRGSGSETPVLCDWDGQAYDALGFPEETVMQVRVYSAEGELLGDVSGAQSPARLKRVLALVP